MPMLNARCDTCGAVFPSGIFIDNSTNISFSGNKSGPCPRCGGMGSLIANDTTIDIINGEVTVKKGWLSQENLAALTFSFERFKKEQDNRPQVESQIIEAFPQLENRVKRLSDERLMILITLLLTLILSWRSNMPSNNVITSQISQIVQQMENSTDVMLSEAFENFEAGKHSIHALQKKILKFFPELEDFIHDLPYAILVAAGSLIINILNRWKPIKAKDYKGLTKEQADEMLDQLKAMREAMTKSKDS